MNDLTTTLTDGIDRLDELTAWAELAHTAMVDGEDHATAVARALAEVRRIAGELRDELANVDPSTGLRIVQ